MLDGIKCERLNSVLVDLKFWRKRNDVLWGSCHYTLPVKAGSHRPTGCWPGGYIEILGDLSKPRAQCQCCISRDISKTPTTVYGDEERPLEWRDVVETAHGTANVHHIAATWGHPDLSIVISPHIQPGFDWQCRENSWDKTMAILLFESTDNEVEIKARWQFITVGFRKARC